MQRPAIVVIPGAWHVPDHFRRFKDALSTAGFDVSVITKPSTDVRLESGKATLQDDVNAARDEISALFPRPVIVIAHSYAGMIMTQAVEGLLFADRQKNSQAGGVVHLIYMAAAIPQAGNSLFDLLVPRPAVEPATPRDNGTIVWEQNPQEILWADVDDEEAARLAPLLVPHSWQTFFQPVTYEAWRDVATTYIHSTADLAMLTSWQKQMLTAVEAAGGQIDVRTYNSSHSPFASLTAEMVRVIEEIAAKYS